MEELFQLDASGKVPKKHRVKKEEYGPEPTKFDLLKEEGGAIYLTKDSVKCQILILPKYIDTTFRSMYNRGILINDAYELAERMFGAKK